MLLLVININDKYYYFLYYHSCCKLVTFILHWYQVSATFLRDLAHGVEVLELPSRADLINAVEFCSLVTNINIIIYSINIIILSMQFCILINTNNGSSGCFSGNNVCNSSIIISNNGRGSFSDCSISSHTSSGSGVSDGSSDNRMI